MKKVTAAPQRYTTAGLQQNMRRICVGDDFEQAALSAA
jgi:hypothetical protein